MPRYNVQHPKTKQWRCFSSIVDDYVTNWMDINDYELWRKEQYGVNCGSVEEANIMTFEEAEEIRALPELDKVVDTVYEAEAIIEADKGEQ